MIPLDVYRGTKDKSLRMAVAAGKGLPEHVDRKDWELMSPGTSDIVDVAIDDVRARGFCFYRLVDVAP